MYLLEDNVNARFSESTPQLERLKIQLNGIKSRIPQTSVLSEKNDERNSNSSNMREILVQRFKRNSQNSDSGSELTLQATDASHSGVGGALAQMAPSKSPWPVRRVSEVPGDLVLGGLMMVHERSDTETCGPVMPQGGIQVPLNKSTLTLKKTYQ